MKHPVDTSTWGEFKVGSLFDVKLSDGDNKPKKLPKGNLPLVSAGTTNNGIVGYFESDTIIFPAGSLTADMFGQVFYQPNDFQTVSHGRVNILVPKRELSPKIGHFIVTILNNVCKKYSFTEMLTSKKLQNEIIPLPLNPGTNPADYSQEDIDWDYMEGFMSRVQDAAKERLANLPEPGQKSKTPVDVSKWGEFKVGELFDKLELKRIKPTFNKHSDLSPVKTDEFDLPLINAKVGNNGIMYYGRSCDWQSDSMTIDIVNDGAASAGMVYAQPQQTGTLYNAYQIKLKQTVHHEPTVSQLLFLTTVIQASIQTKFSYDNKAIWQKVKDETIPLPLKQNTNSSDYSQEDIDWDYMESFMSQFQNLAKNRVEQLTSTHDCDTLTV